MKTTYLFLAVFGCCTLFGVSSSAQIFTTKSRGNWTNPNTWVGGIVPTRTIAPGSRVDILHDVTVDLTDDFLVYGHLNVLGDTLRFPATYTKKTFVYSGGSLVVWNGGFLQNLAANQCEVEIKGGRMLIENAIVQIGKHYKNLNGNRVIRNSFVKVGEDYIADGSSGLPSRDSILYSTIEANISHSGHFELKDDSYLNVANARIFALDGDFKTANRGYVKTLAGAAGGYGFDLIKTRTHLDVDGPWEARIYSYCVDGDIKGSNAADIDFVRAEDCSLAPVPAPSPAALIVINEAYTDPGAGNHEFIELYNATTQPENLNNYTLVTHFNDGMEKGFFVLDFPNIVVPARGWFVASAAFPFNYQGVIGSLSSNFNWNKASAAGEASLKKWVFTGGTGNLTDGNIFYDQAPLPTTGLNDLLYRISGDVSFSFLLYRNGILINRIIAGAGGTANLSGSITSLPALFIDMAGNAPDFSINFGNYVNMPVEKITADAGNDNGFARQVDGGCSSFRKSSTSSNHTPLLSNGGMEVNTVGNVTITSFITRGSEFSPSLIDYKITTASSNLPVELQVIVDNGLMPGQVDVMDTQVDSRTATFSGQSFQTAFQPYNKDIFIQVRQSTGCIDQVVMVRQADAKQMTLPLDFISFTAACTESGVNLKWATEGDPVNRFEVERSTNGRSFRTIGIVFGSDETGANFRFNDNQISGEAGAFYYRIKAFYSDARVAYSKINTVKLVADTEVNLTSYPNPVKNNLTVIVPAQWQGKMVRYELYNLNGSVERSGAVAAGASTFTIDMSVLAKGMYLVKLSCNQQTAQQRIVKN